MLNQCIDFSSTCVWTLGLQWEYSLSSFFFLNSRKHFCSAVLYCTRHLFGHCVTHSYSVTYGADKDLTNSSNSLSNIMSGLIQEEHWGSFVHVSGHTLWSHGTCAGPSHSAAGLLKGEIARGQNIPRNTHFLPRVKGKKNGFAFLCYFFFCCCCFGLENKRPFEICSKMMSRNSIKTAQKTKSNRTYLSCKYWIFKVEKKYELNFFWNTNCLWTEEEPYPLSSGNLLPTWHGEEVPTETLLLFQWWIFF